MSLEEHMNIVLEEFPLDISSTRPVAVGGLDRGTRVLEVDPGKSELIPDGDYVGSLYIVETVSGIEIACHPHIVDDSLKGLCLDCAIEFVKAAMGLDVIDVGELAVLHILRGASGYMVPEALPVEAPIIAVRTEYREEGYRSHADTRNIGVTYRDYSTIEPRMEKASTLLMPDTFATGRSAETALKDLIDSGLSPEKVVLYGFIAIPALVRVGKTCSENGMEMFSFSVCDIAQLARNGYDMPLYGMDESLFRSTGQLRRLGSIVDVETLRRFLPIYVAGLDQPGDWSERQSSLFGGYRDERGDIVGHLRKSMRLIESLRSMNSVQPWYDNFHDDIALGELERLKRTLRDYN